MTRVIFRTAGNGFPVLWLHAFPLNSAMWEGQWAALSGMVASLGPDLPGFGASAAANAVDDLDGLARIVYEEASASGVSHAVVAGCSMGGYLAFALLRVAPEFVSGLALINTRASADTEQGRAKRVALAQRVEREGCGFLVEEWPPSALSPVTMSARPRVVADVRKMVNEASPRGVIAAQRAMANRPDSTGLLGAIRVPAVVIHGLEDTIVPEAEAREMAAAIPGAKFVAIPDAAHLPSLEQPGLVNDSLHNFFAGFELPR
ncbi:MAG TPA: alpha/beta fold hydrolase [Candidatus Eremiobacteraceae bacterium]|nr:alpha/beta fold hydrolase [Candidatus Eremiobacteraceae bacterium]